MPLRVLTAAELPLHVGCELGVSDWHDVTQARVDAFAHATGDLQWIHVNPARAAAGPFGTTVAHGLYTLSLGPALAEQAFAVRDVAFGVNYGYDRVRFTAPVPVGARLRLRAALEELSERGKALALLVTHTFEREGEAKPACVAQARSLLYPA